MAEDLFCKQDVVGSTPTVSFNGSCHFHTHVAARFCAPRIRPKRQYAGARLVSGPVVICPRCNSETSSYAIRSTLFENKYPLVCTKCADAIDLEVANADYKEARKNLKFNYFGMPKELAIANDRAWRTIQEVERFREKLGLPRKPDV